MRMRILNRYLWLSIALATPLAAHAETSVLRVVCEGDDVGAEVSVNGKFKGECPVDMSVAPGTLKLRVVKAERQFEQEIRIGEGVLKRVEANLQLIRVAKVLNYSPIPGPKVARQICTPVNVARQRDSNDRTASAEANGSMDSSPKTSANQQCTVVYEAGPPSAYQITYDLDGILHVGLVRKKPGETIRIRILKSSDGSVLQNIE
jgi:hypothetical protein